MRIAAAGARAAGAEVTLIELENYALPLFNEDDESEHGLPENARKLKDLMLSHQGFLISSPEYNSSITPLLKNTIDWASRPGEGRAAAGLLRRQGGPAHERLTGGRWADCAAW